ncbi:MAG: dTDP-4-dehydrorhamnose 3,5-epimerase family protein [Candidatus Helarchaeota archaeon]
MTMELKGKQLDYNEVQEGVSLKEVQRFGDDRGVFTNISFQIDDKDTLSFKRSYVIINHQSGVVRAFHGHKKEGKLFYVPKGAFKFIIMSMKTKEWKEYNLMATIPKVLYVPGGYYNGFVSLNSDAILVTFSTASMQESINDDYRLPYDFLGLDVWKIKSR